MKKAVFLDRDGTVIVHVHYLADPSKVEIVPDGAAALKRLADSGYLLIVVSNQSLVGRGFGTIDDVEAVNARMLEMFNAEGVSLDAVKYCPHHPDENCPNRKPNPGMLLEAAAELDIDLAQSVMVGDNITDVQAGEQADCRMSILIGSEDASNLSEAVALILGDT